MTLRSKLTVAVNALLTDQRPLGQPVSPLDYARQATLASGVLAGQADRIFYGQRTVPASASEDLDLAGDLEDALGGPFVLASVKGLVVAAAPANVNDVVVGAAAAAPWTGLLGATGTLTVRPGAVVAAFAGHADPTGYPVTPDTADILTVANAGAGSPVIYDLVIIGSSA